jgi:hypothetical protein
MAVDKAGKHSVTAGLQHFVSFGDQSSPCGDNFFDTIAFDEYDGVLDRSASSTIDQSLGPDSKPHGTRLLEKS